MTNPFEAFPTAHPLVVHAPVAFLPLATLSFLAALAFRNKALEGASLVLLAAGWAGAVVASWVFHPHTGAMTLLAREALEKHEFWADWTQGLGAGALLAALAYRTGLLHRFHRALRVFALVLYLGAAAAVILAGHYGATLTHVHKVEVEKE